MSAKPLKDWWQQRKGRERLLLAGGALGAVLMLGDLLISQPLERVLRRQRAELEAQRVQLVPARTGVAGDLAVLHRREAELHRREAELHQRLAAARQELATLRQRASESARLPETLRAIAATVGATRLLALDLSADKAVGAQTGAGSRPVTAVAVAASSAPVVTQDDGPQAPRAANPLRLYRLPITLKVSGSWDDLQTLLEQIERHAEALQWSSLELDSAEWPAIQLTLKAHVVSLDPRWGSAP